MLNKTLWEEIIIDINVGTDELASLFLADIDGDGNIWCGHSCNHAAMLHTPETSLNRMDAQEQFKKFN